GHVADADRGEVLLLRVAAQGAEVALDRLPGAARGDAHALVVVADRATGGEGVVEPVAVRLRDAVGDVGEGRRALVGGHHQVRVVAVVADHVARMHDLAVDQVVGDVEHAVDEALVALLALGQPGIAVDRRVGQLLAEEPALGTHGHDHRVLDHLRLDQAQHLGAEVLAAVGPAQAAARHRAEAQVHAFHVRTADPDLPVRPRPRRVGHAAGVDLERDVVGRAAVGASTVLVVDVVAGAQGGVHAADEAAHDPVLVQAGHAVQQPQQRGAGRLDLALAVARAGIHHALQHGPRGLVGRQPEQLLPKRFLAALYLGPGLVAGGRVEARL